MFLCDAVLLLLMMIEVKDPKMKERKEPERTHNIRTSKVDYTSIYNSTVSILWGTYTSYRRIVHLLKCVVRKHRKYYVFCKFIFPVRPSLTKQNQF